MDLLQPHLCKLRKLKRPKHSELEDEVASELYKLQLNHKTLRYHLPRLSINKVTPLSLKRGKTSKEGILIFYPLRYLMLVRKIQKTLTAELEKHFSGRVVLFVAQRKITKRPSNIYKVQRVRRSMTSSAVFENILCDMLFPADIVGQRWKCRVDGSKLRKVFIDTKHRKRMEPRLLLISHVYKLLTHRTVSFGFMWNAKLQQVSTR